jgi:hypothetical protein
MQSDLEREEIEQLASDERKAQLRAAQKRLRDKQKGQGIVDRSIKMSQQDIENAKVIKEDKELPSIDAAVSFALGETVKKVKKEK